jgi:cytochrome c
MMRSWVTGCAVGLFGFVLCWSGIWSQPQGGDAPKDAIPLPVVCKTPLAPPRIHWQVPADVEGELKQNNFNVVQRAADIFAWQEFIALNWPAAKGKRGLPAQDLPITAPGPRVWETWKETTEVFLPDGAEPPPWDAPEPMPEGCRDMGPGKALVRQSKVDELLQGDLQPTKADGALPATLTDQRGRVVRYEIRMNRVLFEYIRKNGLYNGAKQGALDVHVPDGAMLIKAAWRVLERDEERRFYTTTACVSDLPDRSRAKYRRQTVGLVGLHIMHKTPSAPQWIWSTHEQVDNVRGEQPSFYNPRCIDCPTNRQTEPGFPNQVTRLTPIPSSDPDCEKTTEAVDNVQALNRAVQKGLGDTIWRHYELIGTQWPVRPKRADKTPATVFEVLPTLLANTTLETYIQKTSSCMGCHAMARTTRPGTFVSADFTFTLSEAMPRQTNPTIIGPPTKPVTPWDHQQWNSILRGHQLAAHTYELLPEYVPTAKLHCGSCHLSTGGNPKAAWWVGMMKKYQYPGTTNLQKRINGCFERSLHGKPLPIEADDPTMNALILYMQWLDEQAEARKIPMPASPFPPVEPLTGDAGRGRATFLQKCAFCHGADGQGRYESNTYFRPALWGPHSFDSEAGMAKPAMFAPFVHANMPHRSGGELTAQEAWDLAAFVDGQKRPGGK